MPNYRIVELDQEEFFPLVNKYHEEVYENTQTFRLTDALNEGEKKSLKNLEGKLQDIVRLNYGLYCGDKFAGWSWGYQMDASRFYMCNSAVLPQFRRQGFYRKLLEKVVDHVSGLGFQEIFSRHHATNNAVLIPKLQYGFIIKGMEMNDLHGILIHLAYFPRETRRKMMDYRTGNIYPDQEIQKLLKLK